MSTRTNIVLDDDLIARAMAKARVTTKKGAVEAALQAYVRQPDYSGLLALEGSNVLADDYDPKALFTHPRYRLLAGSPLIASEPMPALRAAKKGPEKTGTKTRK